MLTQFHVVMSSTDSKCDFLPESSCLGSQFLLRFWKYLSAKYILLAGRVVLVHCAQGHTGLVEYQEYFFSTYSAKQAQIHRPRNN